MDEAEDAPALILAKEGDSKVAAVTVGVVPETVATCVPCRTVKPEEPSL